MYLEESDILVFGYFTFHILYFHALQIVYSVFAIKEIPS